MEIEDWSFLEKENKDKFAKWFEENPDKIIGETLSKVGTRFDKDKEFTTVITDKEKLYALDVPDYMQLSNDNVYVSTEKINVTATKITEDDVRNIEKSIKKTRKKVLEQKETPQTDYKSSDNVWDYDEVDETYNKHISIEEKQAYVLYLKRFTGKEIKGGFKKYEIEDTKENRLRLLKSGALSFDNSEKEEIKRYKPSFYYASGNIYKKRKSLLEDKDFYVTNFGEDVYNLHLKVINEAYEDVKDSKLSLSAKDISKRLYIKLNSDLAKTFKINVVNPISEKSIDRGRVIIKNWEDELAWKFNELSSGNQYWGWTSRSQSVYSTTEKLSIRDAFIIWLYDIERNSYDLSEFNYILPSEITLEYVYNFYVLDKGNIKKAIPKEYKKEEGGATYILDSWFEVLQKIKDFGQMLFSEFLAKYIQEKDRIAIELVWNNDYNGFRNFDVNKVPILFQFVKKIGADFEKIRPEKRRALGYSMLTGSSCLAYGVGMGKTFASIFIVGQNLDLGLCKRPIFIVPNSVYPQFYQEIKTVLPQYKVNGLWNLGGLYEVLANNIEDNTISIISQSALEKIGFRDKEVSDFLFDRYQGVIEMGFVKDSDMTLRDEKAKNDISRKVEKFLGKAQSGATVFFEEMGWDFITIDEAHNYKNLFQSVKGTATSTEGKRTKSDYNIDGSVSMRAVKLFCLNQYIQSKNRNGNCVLLTATPFTNTPLEIYAMLSLIRYDFLRANGFGQIQDFFDFFAKVSTVSTVTTGIKPTTKTKVIGFYNVVALQGIIYSLIDKLTKDEENSKVERPNKIVLPMFDKRVADKLINVSESNQVSTLLAMTGKQKELWTELEKYSDSKINHDVLGAQENWNNSECGKIDKMLETAKKKADEGLPLNYDGSGVRSIMTLLYGRTIALNPYLYRFSAYDNEPTPAEFVQASPKVEYAIECIKTVKEHHEKTKTPMSGQVIYITSGVPCFHYIQKYVTEYLGFNVNEVGIIANKQDTKIGKTKKSKEEVQDAFLGRRLDISDPLNPKYVDIPDEERVKVLIGSSAIKEGVNLQFYSTCLYNCELEWNPTDFEQVVGRIWRQKNAFANVRIVVPILENSHDAFMFVALRDKTVRINEIWERDGTNEFDLDEYDPTELGRQVSRNPEILATVLKEKNKKELDTQLLNATVQLNSFREVLELTSQITDLYNDTYSRFSSEYQYDNKLQYVWNFLNNFRPSLIDKPLLKDVEIWRNPTRSQESRGLKVNPDGLNYSFEDLNDLMNQFRKDGIIEYPRGYFKGWREEKEKPIPLFKVGEKVTFETRRGVKEGKVIDVFGSESNPSTMSYDIQVGTDPDNVTEDVKAVDNKMVSIDNPPKVFEKIDLGGTELKLGNKGSYDELVDILNYLLKNEEIIDNNSLFYLGIQRKKAPFLYPFVGYSGALNEYSLKNLETLKTFAKFKDFFVNKYLENFASIKFGTLDWNRWIKDLKQIWESKLKPKGINTEDELTIALSNIKEQKSIIETKIKQLNDREYFQELIKEAVLELAERETFGDKPLSPIEGARFFAKPNADYLGNGYLDIFDPKYLKKKESKIEEAKIVEEKPKEESDKAKTINAKIRIYERLKGKLKGEKLKTVEAKLRIYKRLLKKA